MFDKLVIVGPGLIGGSPGLAVREKGLARQCQKIISMSLDKSEILWYTVAHSESVRCGRA
jgi:prephenate dehydrogenase